MFLVGGFFPTHLENMLVKLDDGPKMEIKNIWNHHPQFVRIMLTGLKKGYTPMKGFW